MQWTNHKMTLLTLTLAMLVSHALSQPEPGNDSSGGQPPSIQELKRRTKTDDPYSGSDTFVIEMKNGKIAPNTKERLANFLARQPSESKEFEGSKQVQIMEDMIAYHDLIEALKHGNKIEITKAAAKARRYMEETGITMEKAKEKAMKPKTRQGDIKSTSGRARRALYKYDEDYKWDKCIIPYQWGNVDSDQQHEILITMTEVEQYSGFRFVKNNVSIPSLYGLTHSNYLNFVSGSGCWAVVGNDRDRGGQPISCCSRYNCVHELGHAIGFLHEQKSPLRDDYVRIDYANIDADSWSQFYRADSYWSMNFGYYDPTTPMHYWNSAGSRNYKNAMTHMDPDRAYLVRKYYFNFYFYKEIEEYSKCQDQFCPGAKPVCVNNGFSTVINGKCACLCPPGLDPATNCATPKKTDKSKQDLAWPEGQFSTLKTVDGCPDGFEDGHWYHKPLNYIYGSASYHTVPIWESYSQTLEFCTKTDSSAVSNAITWPKGAYCILRKGGACPTGFDTGYMQMDDVPDQSNNKSSGVLPDGLFDANTRFEFCCRNDTLTEIPAKFPIKKPFILFLKEENCQTVEDMTVVEEYFTWDNDHAENITHEVGSMPYMSKWNRYQYKVYFCYYEPVNKDCSALYELTHAKSELTISALDIQAGHSKLECTYTVKGTKIKMDVTDFNLPCNIGSLEIAQYMPAHKGVDYCGNGFDPTIVASENFIRIVLKLKPSNGDFKFSATFKIITEQCYTNGGKDGSYDGSINYTKNEKMCVPWNQVKQCRFHRFRPETFDDDLTNNFCRNTGVGTDPWCYTNVETCSRDYCDACSIRRCYDLFSDCATLMMKEPNYCAFNRDGMAHKGCRKSCGLCPTQEAKKVSEVTCPPPNVVDSITPSPVKTEYHTGDQVEYVCPTDGSRRMRTCTSSGRWTHLGFVCGACPNGWGYVEGRCYKWFDEYLTFEQASSFCTNKMPRSTLPTVLNKAQSDYIMTIYGIDKDQTGEIWLGLNDKEVEGSFKWMDGTDGLAPNHWTDWGKNQPTNTGDCVVLNSEKKWESKGCDNKRLVVCHFRPLDRTTCADQIRNCDDMIRADPDLCVFQLDYARANCPRSCAYCSDTTPTSTTPTKVCNYPGLPAHTTLAFPTLSVDIQPGNFYEFKCDAGYLHISGDLKRACLLSLALTGESPVCAASSEVEKPVNDVNILERESDNPSPDGYVYSALNSDFRIRDAGKLTKWRFYSTKNGQIALQVWRNLNETYGEFVGQNIISNTGDERVVTFEVPEAKQITVQVGDMIAVHYPPSHRTALALDRCLLTDEPNKGRQLYSSKYIAPDNLVPGSSHGFTLDSWDCKTWSLNAWVK